MEMIQRKILRRFFERGGNYKYRWLPDCMIYPKLDFISRFGSPYNSGLRSHYLELPTMSQSLQVNLHSVKRKNLF